jgi:hypothetical protein
MHGLDAISATVRPRSWEDLATLSFSAVRLQDFPLLPNLVVQLLSVLKSGCLQTKCGLFFYYYYFICHLSFILKLSNDPLI